MNKIFRILSLMVIMFAVFFYYYQISKNLVISHYSVSENIPDSIRIVQLTDLHNAEFGESNSELLDLVTDQNPDIIVMTGDMLNREDEDLSIVKNLISDLSVITPVYYGYGNHEVAWEEPWALDLHEELSAAGAVVLNNEYVDVEINGLEVRIGGYMGYYRQPGMLSKDKEQKDFELAFADDFENTDRFKILLNHIPTQWVDWDYINKYSVDLVFSGHYHGGMIRIPFIDRGLYAPYVEWFPENTKGVFEGSEATCILSAGLGSEYFIPRLNNPPEIVVVDLVPEEIIG